MKRAADLILAWSCLFSLAGSVQAADDPQWIAAMRDVHAAGRGAPGVLLNLGDSITYSMAYFAPLQHARDAKMPAQVQSALQTVDGYMHAECYRWKGDDKGNAGGRTAAWANEHVEEWIDTLRPEVAIIMFGTNDIRQGTVDEHEQNLRSLVQSCLDRGVVAILTTVPPMDGFEDKVREAVEAQRKVASDLQVPLIDFYAHTLNRRPSDWNGTLPQFDRYDQWQVPTIVSKDGVHLSNPTAWQQDYTEEGLRRNGNTLRNYLSLMAYAEVINVVLKGQPPSEVSTTVLGTNPPALTERPESDADRDPVGSAPRITPPHQDWFPKAPPLAEPTGQVLHVQSTEELYAATENVRPGGTIFVADGHYRMPRSLRLNTDAVALRGAAGDRTRVVLDFADSQHHEGIAISHCTGVTVADLTVANVRQNGIKINSNLGVSSVTIYNVIGHNIWQRHIKGPKVPDQRGRAAFAERCRIQYCLFYNDRPKQRGDDPWEDANPQMGFNYVGGIDVMSAKDWVISDNVFTGIHGHTGEARGAVFLWHNATDCVIERNIILDCDAGICLGNSSARGERRHANRCLVRNNFVVRCPESNILAAHTRDCKILHNSVHDPDGRFGRLLRVLHANDGLLVANNIFSGPNIVVETDESQIDVRNNLIRPVGNYFVDPTEGNLHLTSKVRDAIGQATVHVDVADDIDGQRRDDAPDLGADEHSR